MTESFYFGNISPQLPGFNRGIWKRLESQSREWAIQYGSIYIVTGPIFSAQDSSIGVNEVRVPSHFYKAILLYNDTIPQSIGFLFPHKKLEGDLSEYVVTIDSLESFGKLDLFYRLPDEKEINLESNVDKSFWFEQKQ